MRFRAEHRFPAAPLAVVAALADAELARSIALPDLAPPEVLASEDDGTRARLQLRYEYVGDLDPIARRLLGRRRLTFVQELCLDRDTLTGTLSIAVEADPRQIRGDAIVELVADGTATVRRIAGDFAVRVPLVGATAERKILPGVLRRLDVEATAIAAHVAACP